MNKEQPGDEETLFATRDCLGITTGMRRQVSTPLSRRGRHFWSCPEEERYRS